MKMTFDFSKKIMMLFVVITLIATLVIGFVALGLLNLTVNRQAVDYLDALTNSTYHQIDSAVDASVKNYLRSIAEKNHDMIAHLYKKFQEGQLNEVEALTLIEDLLLSQTIGKTGYVYILNSQGTLVVHPFLKDDNISEYLHNQEQITNKEGYLEYEWQNPNDSELRDKALYMTYFEPWDMIISVSSYKSEFINLVNVEDFNDNILSIPLGETGYIYIMDSTGLLIIHPKQAGVTIYDSVDQEGNYFIQDIITNKKGRIVYPWINRGEARIRDKIVVYDY